MDLHNDLLTKSFMETLTHDIKTPIIAQIRILELLLDGTFGKLTNDQNEILKLTLDSSKYMHEMIMTLVSNYQFEEIELDYSKFNIIEVTEDCIRQVKDFLQNNNIKIVILRKTFIIWKIDLCKEFLHLLF